MASHNADRPSEFAAALGLSGHHASGSNSGEDPHKIAAQKAAAKLLDEFTPPKGATPTDTKGNFPPMAPATTNLIVVHRSWFVSGDAEQLADQLLTDPNDGFQQSGFTIVGNSQGTYGGTLVPIDAPNTGGPAQISNGVSGSLQLSTINDTAHRKVLLTAYAVVTRDTDAAPVAMATVNAQGVARSPLRYPDMAVTATTR